jgi:hypothetical protein
MSPKKLNGYAFIVVSRRYLTSGSNRAENLPNCVSGPEISTLLLANALERVSQAWLTVSSYRELTSLFPFPPQPIHVRVVQVEERITRAGIDVAHNAQVAANAKMSTAVVGHIWHGDAPLNDDIELFEVGASQGACYHSAVDGDSSEGWSKIAGQAVRVVCCAKAFSRIRIKSAFSSKIAYLVPWLRFDL